MTASPGDIRLSVSKIETYLLCPLKWYWAYVMNLPTPETPAKELGSEVHELCENYLKTGKEPHKGKSGAILRAGLHLLPPVGKVRVEEWTRLENIGAHPLWRQAVADGTIGRDWEALTVEQALGIREPYLAGANLVGKIDMHLPRLADLPEVLESRDRNIIKKMGLDIGGLIYVSDLKTTGDFRWSKSSIELASNTQMMAYSYVVGVQAYEREGVRWDTPDGTPAGALVEHVQVRTKGQPMGKRERAVVKWSQIEKNMGTIDSHAREMLKLSCKGEAEVRDNSKNARPASCGAFGGCPFQEMCPHSPIGRSRGKAIPTMGTFRGMQRPDGGATTTTTTATATTTETTGATMSTKAGSNKAALFGAAGAAPATASAGKGAVATTQTKARTPSAGTGAKAPPSAGKGAAGKPGADKGAKGAGTSLNPPDAAASAPPVDPQAGVNLITENIDMNDGALAIGFGRKLVAKLGCDFDAVIALGGFIVEDDVIYAPAADGGEAPAEEQVEESGDVAVNENGIPVDGDGAPLFTVSELKTGKFRAYTAEGTAIPDEEGNPVYSSYDAAFAAAWAATVGVSEEATEAPVEAEQEQAESGTGEAQDYTASQAYAGADAQAKVAVDALAALVAETTNVTSKQVDEAIKTACNIKRLHGKTRDEIVAVGVEAGAFAHDTDGGIRAIDSEQAAGEEQVAADGEQVEVEVTPVMSGISPSLVVLVDCLPVGHPAEDLSAYLASYEDAVAEQGLDVRGKGSDYGKGGKAVAARLLIAGMSEPLTGWWAISSRHPYVEEVLSVLVRFGAVVVRGVR